jgi:hypothetical protein
MLITLIDRGLFSISIFLRNKNIFMSRNMYHILHTAAIIYTQSLKELI